jgi:hypothetical protein
VVNERTYDSGVSWKDDVWLDTPCYVPAVLQPVFKVYGRDTQFAVTEALATELGLRTKPCGVATLKLLYRMVDPLARAVEDGWLMFDRRPLDIARTAVAEIDMTDAAIAMVELGWGNQDVKGQVRELGAVIDEALAQRLGQHVDRMMRRWHQRGLFDLPSPRAAGF